MFMVQCLLSTTNCCSVHVVYVHYPLSTAHCRLFTVYWPSVLCKRSLSFVNVQCQGPAIYIHCALLSDNWLLPIILHYHLSIVYCTDCLLSIVPPVLCIMFLSFVNHSPSIVRSPLTTVYCPYSWPSARYFTSTVHCQVSTGDGLLFTINCP